MHTQISWCSNRVIISYVHVISRSNKVYFKCLKDKTSEAFLDLDALSGFTEIRLEVQEEAGVKHIEKLGVSLKPSLSKTVAPSQMVYIVPRYVISNESEVAIIVHQCYMEVCFKCF